MIYKIYDEWRVPYSEQNSGWINTQCPFCGDAGQHLGCPQEALYFHCWRCGWHPVEETLSLVLHVQRDIVRKILRQHRLDLQPHKRVDQAPKVFIHPFKYPTPVGPLAGAHQRYLKRRGFDPVQLCKEWELQGTGPVATLDNIDYRFRIVIPIMWDGRVVSFQARDITGKSPFKYKACPKPREEIHHKHILYGKQEYWESSRIGIIVEGVVDAWRIGPAAAATFGIEFSMEQVLQMGKHFDRLFILYDKEPTAQRQAKKLSVKLRMLGKEVLVIDQYDGDDPGSMKESDAHNLVHDLLGRIY